MRKLIKYLPLVFLLTCEALSAQIRTPHVTPENSLIRFTENKNQWESFVKYRAQLDGGALYIQHNALTYSFYDKETYRGLHGNTKAKPVKEIRTTGFDVNFINSNANTKIESTEPTADYCNYFIGKDPSKWAGNVKNYRRLLYNDLWNGINMEILGGDNHVKYNFYLKPGADAANIKLQYTKLEKISLHKKTLVIKTTLNEIVEHEPYAYQIINGETIDVPCNYTLNKNIVSFDFPKGYNKNYELVIDPVLVFSAQSGSTADNFGMTATYDSLGNLYSGGTCFNQGFPMVNAYDSTYNGVVAYGMTDVVITKYDSAGIFLHYSTYLGGAISSEIVTSLIVDKQNNLFLYGATGSSDFPTTPSAYDPTFNGGDTMTFMFNGTYFFHGTDIYVAKLSPAGNQLLAATFIGGGKNDGVNTNIITTYTVDYLGSGSIYTLTESKADSLQFNYGDQYRGEIQLDNAGYPVICSSSRSSDFPTKNPVDATLGGMQDAVVFKFDPNLSALQWSTFFGGSNNDAGYALFIAQNNETYFTGGTRSNDLTTTPSAYKTTFGGGKADGYIGKISASGSNLMACTYIGTNDYDQSYFIQLDKSQNAYVLGQSLGNMPVTNVTYSNPNSKQFVTKLDSSLSAIVYSTIIGNGNGIINLSPAAFLIDCSENIYISGWGGNIIYGPATINMPLTANAYQSSSLDGYNFYLMVLSKNAQALLYATYFGGAQSHEHVDGGTSRFDKKGIIYQSVCAGCGGHDDFPIYPVNAWPGTPGNPNHNTDNNNCNNGVFKFNFEYNSPHAVLNTNVVKGCSPLTVNFTNSSVSYTHYTWDFGGSDTTSTVLNPVKTFTVPGTYTVTLLVSNSACFAGFDTTRITITVYPPVTANFHYTVTPCGNTYQFTDSSYNTITKWSWNLGDGSMDTVKNPAHSYMQSGTYTVTDVVQNQYGCKDSMKKVLVITGVNLSISANTVKCLNQSIQLNASGGISYTWSPASSLNNANIPNPIATPTVNTQYTLALSQVDMSGDTCISILHTTVGIAAVPTPSLSTYATPDTIYVGGSSQLGTYVSGGGTIQWSPTYSLSDPTSFNPTASPHHTQTYTAVYTNAAGCTFPLSSVTIYVITKDCDPTTIFVPNTFTPNNDGMNDVLYARSPLISDIHFVIADRWGQIVFTTDDLTKGWDGNFNGKQCNPDVFGYYITYKCNNGKSSFKKGNITLIR